MTETRYQRAKQYYDEQIADPYSKHGRSPDIHILGLRLDELEFTKEQHLKELRDEIDTRQGAWNKRAVSHDDSVFGDI